MGGVVRVFTRLAGEESRNCILCGEQDTEVVMGESIVES